MKKLSVLWLLLCIVLLVLPTMAQDTAEETPLAMFGDETGMFTLHYPADLHVMGASFWAANSPPVPMVAFVSSPDFFDSSLTPPWTPIKPGNWGIAVLAFPKAMFMQTGLAEDASILEVANAFVAMNTSEGSEGNMTVQSDLITLENGKEAALITGIGDDGAGGGTFVEENYLIVHEITDGVILVSSLVSAVDGRTDEMIAAHLALTNSVEFTGTADEVMAGMMAAGQ